MHFLLFDGALLVFIVPRIYDSLHPDLINMEKRTLTWTKNVGGF